MSGKRKSFIERHGCEKVSIMYFRTCTFYIFLKLHFQNTSIWRARHSCEKNLLSIPSRSGAQNYNCIFTFSCICIFKTQYFYIFLHVFFQNKYSFHFLAYVFSKWNIYWNLKRQRCEKVSIMYSFLVCTKFTVACLQT